MPAEKPTSRREYRTRMRRPSPLPGTERHAADSAPTVLVICTGNICRSPMADVLLRERLRTLGVHVHSAGTGALAGHMMTPKAQQLAVAHGASAADASAHRARQLTPAMLTGSDLVLAMTREHRTAAVQLAPAALKRVFAVREFAVLARGVPIGEASARLATPRARLAAALESVSAQRGIARVDAESVDVVDPYRRSLEVYEQAFAQLLPGIDAVTRVIRAALTA